MVDTLTRRLKAYETYRRTYSELSRLNTRELADIGLTRDGIKAVARDRAGV